MNNKDYTVKPYEVCEGRKYRYMPQLRRPWSALLDAKLCNEHFSEKNKIRFIKQIFRWYDKDPTGFKLKCFLKIPYTYKDTKFKLSEGDIIYIVCRSYKAAWKKLLSKLNFKLIDYKILKRRKYCLNLKFHFIDLDKNSKEITLDIESKRCDKYNIHITLNSYYIKDFEIIMENFKIWKI